MHAHFLTQTVKRIFPELTSAVAQLKSIDRHFTQYDALDSQITKYEMSVVVSGDVSLEKLKKKCLQFKDALYWYTNISYNLNAHTSSPRCILE